MPLFGPKETHTLQHAGILVVNPKEGQLEKVQAIFCTLGFRTDTIPDEQEETKHIISASGNRSVRMSARIRSIANRALTDADNPQEAPKPKEPAIIVMSLCGVTPPDGYVHETLSERGFQRHNQHPVDNSGCPTDDQIDAAHFFGPVTYPIEDKSLRTAHNFAMLLAPFLRAVKENPN
jgi:hypothetical protein